MQTDLYKKNVSELSQEYGEDHYGNDGKLSRYLLKNHLSVSNTNKLLRYIFVHSLDNLESGLMKTTWTVTKPPSFTMWTAQ